MKLYVCTDHAGHYPIGVASVVVAPNIVTARQMLDQALGARGLRAEGYPPFTLVEIPLDEASVTVLCDGSY